MKISWITASLVAVALLAGPPSGAEGPTEGGCFYERDVGTTTTCPDGFAGRGEEGGFFAYSDISWEIFHFDAENEKVVDIQSFKPHTFGGGNFVWQDGVVYYPGVTGIGFIFMGEGGP